ncbi:MAG: tryptophan 2,3-dioxygenase family protein [Flavobacteriales bacterium]
MNEIVNQIEKKYTDLGQDPNTYLRGLLHAKPMSYWDYVEVETLLSLQKPRTNFKDEEVFIIYHQVTELVLKLIIHELKQLTSGEDISIEVFSEKLRRIERYIGLLSNSFSIMNQGMSYDDYNQFRLSLAPASGFQSAQFRILEIYCTDLYNLVNERGRARLPEEYSIRDLFENIYWQDAGKDYKTGVKSLTLSMFEEKYIEEFVRLAEQKKTSNLYVIYKKMELKGAVNEELKTAMREVDLAFNVRWPLVHLETAQTYLNKKGENKAATGASEWQKYLHPVYQRRIFFPDLWSKEELANWGNFMHS